MSSELTLYVYNYNYSSWSMRAGIAIRQTGAAFVERNVTADEQGAAALKALSPTGLFPLLQHGSEWIWDSLAIGEYLAELFPEAGLWPAERAARAHARTLVAEMHSGFSALRTAMPMNIRAHYPGFLQTLAVRQDVARISAIWQASLDRFGGNGPFLFGAFSLVDAFFAPVVMRFASYDVALTAPLSAYVASVRVQAFVKDWVARAASDRYVNPNYELTR